jgi:hypothetical protein
MDTTESEFKQKMAELDAQQKQIERQQGLGRPIVSTLFNGYRLVAVGSQIRWSKNWKTFHDFLLEYIRTVIGSDWGNLELKKRFEDRHPIIQWSGLVVRYLKEKGSDPGQINTAPMTGAVAAYLGLAYNLYLLAHNSKIQKILIERLKNKDQFPGAYYETFAAAAFIKAGFDLEFENEADGSRSHCEFTATYRKTGVKFSIEAKARAAGKSNADVGNQLYNALLKEANYKRVVFIDINVPDDVNEKASVVYLDEALASLRSREASLTIQGAPAPKAYVIITNHPYQYSLETPHFRNSVVAEGFKMPDFKIDTQASNIREALRGRANHREILMLMDSIREHYEIPSTFDGEIPEFAFREGIQKWIIGQKYIIPINGEEVVGKLIVATVSEVEKLMWCVLKLEDGSSFTGFYPITDEELSAYRRHPDTFFGVYRKQGRKIDNFLELFDGFYDCYRHTDRSKLLEFLKDQPDYDVLQGESQEELAITCCERWVYSEMKTQKPVQPTGQSGG